MLVCSRVKKGEDGGERASGGRRVVDWERRWFSPSTRLARPPNPARSRHPIPAWTSPSLARVSERQTGSRDTSDRPMQRRKAHVMLSKEKERMKKRTDGR